MTVADTELYDNTYRWIVHGMDCPSCAGKIRGAVERLRGVSDVQVSVMKETLTLVLDTQQTSPERVEKTVERLGYTAQSLPNSVRPGNDPAERHSHCGCDGNAHSHGHDMMTTSDRTDSEGTLSWKVGGMDCASCAAKIRGAVESLPGVSDVKVSVMNETLTLKLDEQQTSPESVEKSVKRLGYSVAPRAAMTPDMSGGDTASQSDAADGDAADAVSASPKRWFLRGKGRLVLMTGAVLLAAVVVRLLGSERIKSQICWMFAMNLFNGLDTPKQISVLKTVLL